MKQSFILYHCKIKIIPLLVFICFLVLLLRLGFWQLGRADEKRVFLANQDQQMQQEALPLAELLIEKSTEKNIEKNIEKDIEIKVKKHALRYRRVILHGHYDVKHQFLLDNQFHDGKVGYFVLTPFILAASAQTVLINRGWVLMDKDRTQLPDINFRPMPGELAIVGVINLFPEVGLTLKGADEPGKGWPSVVQLINGQKITKKLEQPILNFQVQLAAEQAHGYIREWRIKTRIPPEKHVAYAFQWFALAVTLTLLTLWGCCKNQKND